MNESVITVSIKLLSAVRNRYADRFKFSSQKQCFYLYRDRNNDRPSYIKSIFSNEENVDLKINKTILEQPMIAHRLKPRDLFCSFELCKSV